METENLLPEHSSAETYRGEDAEIHTVEDSDIIL